MERIEKGTVLVDTYEIIDIIGSGGGGVTYKAHHLRLQTDVVVKKIKEEVLRKVNIRAEADILKNLKHAYLPRVYDFIEAEDGVYTVIDYIPGDNLEDAVKKYGPFDEKLVLKWANQLAEALAYLHSQNPPIIHSDIKPANIMLTDDGDICLIDFNISLALGESMESAIGVSPGFSPPEQFRSVDHYANLVARRTGNYNLDFTDVKTEYLDQIGRGIDQKSDIYSLGMTLIYLLTGIKSSLDYDERVTIDDVEIYVQEGFDVIIRKMINYNSDYRYADGVALLDELRNIHKLDSRYKAVHKVQALLQIVSLVLFVIGVGMVTYSLLANSNKKNSQYNRYLDRAEKYIEESEFEDAEEMIDLAMSMDSKRGDAYRERVYLLYSCGEYEAAIDEGISYINSPSLETWLNEKAESTLKSNERSVGDIYYLIGNSYYELGEYSYAAEYIEQALEYNNSNGTYYRDYAIALAKIGEIDDAIEQLDIAEDLDLADDSVYLVKGQIAFLEGEYEDAVDYFEKSMTHAESDQILKRALFMRSDAYNAMGPKYSDYNIAMLNEYKESFGNTGGLMVKEYLANAYLLKASQDPAYNDKALEILKEIVDSGYSSFHIKENIAIIYGNMGEYGNAVSELMELADEYPENYNVYKDLAFIEIYSQKEKDNQNRDYHQFKIYFDKAKSLCNQPDDQMEMLERTAQELVSGGWELN